MRRTILGLLLCALVAAEDHVHLENGRVLRGTVVEEDADGVVVELGAGRISVPRDRIRLVERGAAPGPPRRTVTERDEWFLVLHRDQVVGWRRLVRIARARWVQVEERTVFFRPGGGTDVDVRRVERATRDGRPLEFLLMEGYGGTTEVTSGQVRDGRLLVRVVRDGEIANLELDPPPGWTFALPAWSAFLADARPGDARRVRAFDPRRLEVGEIVLRCDEDDAAPAGDPRPCRALSLVGEVRRARALCRAGEGTVRVELNGPTLVARRATRERVELAREAHREPAPLTVDEANRYPFYQRPKALTVRHPRAGFRIAAPDAGWMAEAKEADEGLVLSFEKLALFASYEVFAHPLPDADADAARCLDQALARLRLAAERVGIEGEAEAHELSGLPALTLALRARHRGEDLRCLLTVVRAPDRVLVLLGAAPERWWRWALPDFRRFAETLVVVP